jgi:polysaccharide export outer membrane protein
MRLAMNVRRIGLLVTLALTTTLFAQQKQTAPPPQQQTEPKPELGPSTSKTTGELQAQPSRETVITAAPVDPKKYIIGPEDIIRVNVWKDTDFTGVFQVRPDGKFSMNLLGDITAAGLTPDQLSQNISKALENYLVKPQVTVSVAQVLSKSYYLTGEVNRTGKFPLVVPTTIMEALTNAGGFREYAKTKKIIIMRGKDRIKFNYNDVIKGKNLEQNILLQDGDYVHVP